MAAAADVLPGSVISVRLTVLNSGPPPAVPVAAALVLPGGCYDVQVRTRTGVPSIRGAALAANPDLDPDDNVQIAQLRLG